MSFPVIPPELLDKYPQKSGVVTNLASSFKEGVTKSKEAVPSILEKLIVLVIAFWYFPFTGLALLFGRKLPQQWLNIATKITKDKIAKIIKNEPLLMVSKQADKVKYKVVDIETTQPIKLHSSDDHS